MTGSHSLEGAGPHLICQDPGTPGFDLFLPNALFSVFLYAFFFTLKKTKRTVDSETYRAAL